MPYKNKKDQAAAAARHYQQNKVVMIERAKKRRDSLKEELYLLIRGLKNNTPCTDCGKQYPYYVMQFDHVRGNKMFNIADNNQWWSKNRVLAEIEKCEIVCANCHAERTFGAGYCNGNMRVS